MAGSSKIEPRCGVGPGSAALRSSPPPRAGHGRHESAPTHRGLGVGDAVEGRRPLEAGAETGAGSGDDPSPHPAHRAAGGADTGTGAVDGDGDRRGRDTAGSTGIGAIGAIGITSGINAVGRAHGVRILLHALILPHHGRRCEISSPGPPEPGSAHR